LFEQKVYVNNKKMKTYFTQNKDKIIV